MNTLSFTLVFLILMGIGFIATNYKIVDDKFINSLSALVFKIVFPALIINSMQLKSNPEDLLNGASLIIIAITSLIIAFTIGTLMNLITGCEGDKARMLRYGVIFPNFSLMAFPVIESFYGQKGLFCISIFTIPVRIAFYMLSSIFIKGFHADGNIIQKHKNLINNLKQALLSPTVLAVPVGLCIYFFAIPLPFFISKTLTLLAATATPLGMIISGLALPREVFIQAFKDKAVLFQAFIKLIIIPAISFLLLSFVNIDPLVKKVSILYCAMPMAASPIVFAVQLKSDVKTCAKCILVTTVLSVFTLPTWAWIVENF